MRLRLFYWLYPPYLATILLSTIAFTVFTAQGTTNFFLGLSSLELKQTALMTANTVTPLMARPDADVASVQNSCDALVRGTDIRLTVIDSNGRVVADTGTKPEKMDIHLDREEVREALSDGAGSAMRKSISTGILTTYEAVAIHDSDGQTIAVLRASMPFRFIGDRQTNLVIGVILFGLVLTAGVSLLAMFLARRLLAPILRIHSGAQSFSSGNFSGFIPEEGPLEIANLAGVMNKMAADLDGRIKTIREQKNQAEAILNGITESIAVIDRNLEIRGRNPAFAKLFEGDETGLLALTRNTELCDFMEAAIRSDGPIETGLTLYGERPRRLRLTSAPLENGDTVLVINDLTHLTHLETVRKDFTTNVSHELRTPITAIKGSLETLNDEGFSDPALCASLLGMAIKGTDRLEAIIEDLMSLARVEEEEKAGLDMKRLELDSVIDSALDDISPRLEAASLRLERDGETGIAVNGHEGLLKQALLNLLDNAVKYGADGGVIGISTKVAEGYAVVSIRDEGRGIPEKDRARIFERFYRVDKARSRESGGTGLGLAIVKHIAVAHAGSVRLEKSEGNGSVFSLSLPIAR